MIEQFPDMQEIQGQYHVKRALEIAAAGRHNILLVGPQGAGKGQLAQSVHSILPVGDESPYIIENLDTCTDDVAQIAQSHWLIATLKPCPCGFYGDITNDCHCLIEEVAKYRARLKDIVATCFDIEIEVPLDPQVRVSGSERSDSIRQRVEATREIQRQRYVGTNLKVNADFSSVDDVQQYCQFEALGQKLLDIALRQLHLTPQQFVRMQSVARTVTDLKLDSSVIDGSHVAEAIVYRSRFIKFEI